MWIFDKLPTLSRRDALASCSSPPPHPRHCDISSEKPTSRKNCNSALWNAMVAPLRYEEEKLERKSIKNFQLSTRMPTQRFGRERFPLVPGRGEHPQQQKVTIMIISHLLSLVDWCFIFLQGPLRLHIPSSRGLLEARIFPPWPNQVAWLVEEKTWHRFVSSSAAPFGFVQLAPYREGVNVSGV